MATTDLKAETREVFGKHVRRLRREGIVPANVYGHGASHAIQAPDRTLELLLAHGGRTGVVTIDLGSGEPLTAVFKGLQRDPRTGRLQHVDFQAVSMEELISSSVPLHFVGEAPAVRTESAVLLHPTTEVLIQAKARDLPSAIEVDLSGLVGLHDAIKIGDLTLPPGVALVSPAEEVVAVVLPPKVEREEAVEEEAAEAAAAPAEAVTPAEAAPAE